LLRNPTREGQTHRLGVRGEEREQVLLVWKAISNENILREGRKIR
jgi:hypothetical protein